MRDFWSVLKEREPINRASFLAHVYANNREEFKQLTPDEILVDEFGIEKYIELANKKLVPIAAIPAGIMLT